MIKAVCFDLGDTLISEETVNHDSYRRAITANVIESTLGARNILANTGLKEYFDTIVISGELGIEKPDRRIFEAALKALGVKAEDAVMIGNRVDTDIVGANRSGMVSVWFKWNNRYPALIDACEKKPDFTICSLFELPKVLGLS
jgi:FMN phosphatase YigB (HAD superfamily)